MLRRQPMADDDLVFESTTDTPEQIREGLGLDPVAPDSAVAPSTEPSDGLPSEPVPAPEEPPVAAAPAETRTRVVTRRDPATGRFVTVHPPSAPPPVAAAPAVPAPDPQQLQLQLEAARARLAQLEAPPPQPPPQAPPQAPVAPYRDPGVATYFEQQRQLLGTEPQQVDFDDYAEFRRQERSYDRALAALDAREALAHERAALVQADATARARTAVEQQFQSFAQRQVQVKARHADFEQVMADGAKIQFRGLPHADDIQRAIVEHRDGPEIVYYLAKHPDQLAHLHAQPSAHLALAELGAVAMRAAAAAGAPAPAGAVSAGQPTAVSRAPEPQGTVLGGTSTFTAPTPESARDYQEYKRVRNLQERAKRGG